MINLLWLILGIITIVLLIVFFRGRSAVWGGFTVGILIGFIVTIIGDGFSWLIIAKISIIGTIVGFIFELIAPAAHIKR